MKEVRHEGTLPGKTLSSYIAVTPRYRLHSFSFTSRDLDIKLICAVTLFNGGLYFSGFALKEANTVAVSVLVEHHPVA